MRDKDLTHSTDETLKAPSSAPAVGSLAWYVMVEERAEARAHAARDALTPEQRQEKAQAAMSRAKALAGRFKTNLDAEA